MQILRVVGILFELGNKVDGLFFLFYIFFFWIYVGCPGQLTRTTTIPHGPLDTLQAQEQVRHPGGDRRAHRGSNPGRGRNKSYDWPQQLDPQVQDGRDGRDKSTRGLCNYYVLESNLSVCSHDPLKHFFQNYIYTLL